MKILTSTSCLTTLMAIFLVATTVDFVWAQQTQSGYLGRGKDQYSVFVFGDALAGGLWSGTARVAKNHPRLRFNGRYREGSGLAKPRIYDWEERLPRTLENKSVDIAIVFIGTNDAQDIRRQGAYLAFNSQEWLNIYTNSVANMMRQLTANKTAVYWVEVPPVRRSELDNRLKIVANIHSRQAAIAGIRFVEIRRAFTTSQGEFTMVGAGTDGQITRLRSRNGIRFIKSGNNKLANIVLQQIEKDIAIADGEKPITDFPVPDSSKIATENSGPYAGPVFGSSSSDNQALIIQPENMPLAGIDQSTNVLVSVPTFGSQSANATGATETSGIDVLKILMAQVTPGSAAHSLFSDGTWPKMQSGRLDDFTQDDN